MWCAFALAFITLASLVSYAATAPQAQPRITQPIDNHVYVTLHGNTRPEAKNTAAYRGPVAAETPVNHILLFLQRSPEQEQALNEYIESLNDRKSSNYHKWLSAEEYGEYGVAEADINKITNWLGSQGFTINRVYPNNMLIDISGTAGSIAQAFHTQMGQLEVNGKLQIANLSDPQIPAALAPVISGFFSLNNFRPHAMNKPISQYTWAGCASSTSKPTEPGTCYAMTPQDNQTIYSLNPLYASGISGQGQTVYLVEDTDTYGTAGSNGKSDWNTYRSTFGLNANFPQGNYNITHPGGCPDPGTNGDDGEAAIDVEVASAVAPSANINLISCASGTVTFGGLIALQNLINEGSPTLGVVSVSYGVCEVANGNGGNAAFDTTYQQAASEGFSVFVASGDEGPSSCSVDFTAGSQYDVTSLGVTGWGETPYNVVVGGTDFEDYYNAKTGQNGGLPISTYWNSSNTSYYGSAKQYVPEIPWNDACASTLISQVANGNTTTYGSTGTCNKSPFNNSATYLSTGAGSGGASNCASGSGGVNSSNYLITEPQCQGYTKPSYQTGQSLTGGLAVYGANTDGVRDIPDVSMFAANGVWGHYEVVCWSDPSQTSGGAVSCSGAPSTWAGFGGTSIAAPSMAAVQALINQQTGQIWGNPNPIYYQIGQTEYGTAGGTFQGTSCNSSGSGGPGIACAFNDVTQGDIDLACEYNSTTTEHHCYKPSGTHGVDSTDVITAAAVLNGGSGYTSAPTCAIAGPTNNNPYKSPTGSTLFAGGTQATCTASVNSGTTTAVWSVVIDSATAAGMPIELASPTGSPVCGPYTLTGASTTAIATALNTSINSGCALATSTVSSSTVTITAKTAGYAGAFNTFLANNGTLFQQGYVTISQTTAGQGPNYVSGITIIAGGSGYQPDTPVVLTGVGSGAVAIANTSPGTASNSYQPAYGAAPGYDMATGLGSPNAAYLLGQCTWSPGQVPALYHPAPNSSLTSTSATFGWCVQPGATNYWLDVGTVPYGNTLWQSGPLSPSTFAQSVNTLPSDGSTIYVTWWYYVNGAWSNTEYQYQAEGGSEIGVMTSPMPGSTLTASSQQFTWTAGTLSTAYWIDAGSSPEGNNYFQSGNIGNVTTYNVTNLPTDGSTIYITLWSYVNGSWLYNEYTYIAAGGSSNLAQMLSPTPSSEIDGYSATFTWSAGNESFGLLAGYRQHAGRQRLLPVRQPRAPADDHGKHPAQRRLHDLRHSVDVDQWSVGLQRVQLSVGTEPGAQAPGEARQPEETHNHYRQR